MVNGRYYVVYEFQDKGPSLMSYGSEKEYRDSHVDRKGITRFHEGLQHPRAEELFLRLSEEWEKKKNSGRKKPPVSDVSEVVDRI